MAQAVLEAAVLISCGGLQSVTQLRKLATSLGKGLDKRHRKPSGMYRLVPTPAALVPGGGRTGGFAAANKRMEQQVGMPSSGSGTGPGKPSTLSRRPSVFNVGAAAFAVEAAPPGPRGMKRIATAGPLWLPRDKHAKLVMAA